MNDFNPRDMFSFMDGVQKEVAAFKAMVIWMEKIAMLRPIIKMAQEHSSMDETKVMTEIMKSTAQEGVELSVEEAETFVHMFNLTLELIDIFNDNFDDWSEKGAFIEKLKAEQGQVDDATGTSLDDIIGF